MDYDNTNSGVLFKNDKQGNEKRPDYKGSIDVNGTEDWLSSWIKDGQKGKFMSLSVQAKDEQPKVQNGSPPAPADDTIPF